MKHLRFLLAFGIVLCYSAVTRGDLIFSVAQSTPGPIVLGSTATFDVLVRTNTGTQDFANLGFDLTISNGSGAGGIFVDPTTNFMTGPGWFIVDTPPENSTVAFFDGTAGNGLTGFTTTDKVIGRISLSAAGAQVVPASYSLSLGNIVASASSSNITTSFSGPLSYTISAVPEPTSMALVCVVGAGGFLVRMRRRK